jgi:hypothetical protein
VSYLPGRSLVASDTDDDAVSMSATVDIARGTATVTVTDRRTRTGSTLRDRNLGDSTCPE